MTDSEVTRALTTVEKSATCPAVTTTVGPFSVFQTQSASTRDIDHPSSPNPGDTAMGGSEETNQPTTNSPIIPMVDSPYQTTSELPQFPESTVDTTVPPSDVCVGGDQAETPIGTLATESPDDAPVVNTRTSTTTSLSNLPDYLCPTSHEIATTPRGVDVTVSQSPGWMERNDHSPRESAPGDLGVILFENDMALAIMEDTTAAMLMHHYMQHVVHLMQPVSHPRNPWKTVYLPLALHGSSQLDLPKSWNQLHSASVAVFHGVLSIAAVNLQSMEADQESLERLACHHKQRALVALQSTLATKSTPYKGIMAAILSLVSADVS
jgi:arginine metabolism regulation protein II